MGLFDRIRGFLARYRDRVGRPLLILLALLALLPLLNAAPRTTSLAVPVGPEHGEVREARLEVLDGEQAVRVVDLRFDDGAPATLRRDVDLTPGAYRVALELHLADGRWQRRVGDVEAPADGVVTVSMREEAP